MAYTRKMAGKVPVLKQDLVFDATPTPGSENAVTSGGVASAIGTVPEGGSKTGADLVDGTLAIDGAGSWTSLTLTTEAALTLLANEGTPSFAITVDNSDNANDVEVTVKTSDETATLKHSVAGGTTIAAGSVVQITAVGDCWTLASFEA